ncbi:protrudin-like isoform X2 [Rhopilema esculentum]|uniref:protrudin-like isoform X2 n=1 Tax=Rhopilema esculentum TaxID=499914 RepID=UPI0031D68150
MATKTTGVGGYSKAVKYDLGTFVTSVNRLKKQGKPFTTAFDSIVSIFSWKYPIVTTLLLPAAIIMILFWPEYLLGMCLVQIPILMLITLVKGITNSGTVVTNHHHYFVRKDESPDLIAKRDAMLKAQAHLDMYIDILIEVQDFCNIISSKCEFIHSLIYWKAWKEALLFYVTTVGIIVGIFTVKTRYLVAVVVFSLSVFNSGFKSVVTEFLSYFHKIPSRLEHRKPETMSYGFDDEAKESFHALEDDLESSSSTDSEDLAIKPEVKSVVNMNFVQNQERHREKSGLSIVSKFASSTLASFTRRRQRQGNCSSCSVQFSTILKKRTYCRHCGYSYCSKCCNQRVPRVVFGATAPAAYEERVLVCKSCYAFLMNRMRGTNTEIVE